MLLVIDNYDSFTYNLVQYLGELGADVLVRRNDAVSVEEVGAFKPNPQVYRYAARVLRAEPCELLMVSSNSFDVVGARVSGYRAAYVNRYDLPYDETPYRFDIEAGDFSELATKLGCE